MESNWRFDVWAVGFDQGDTRLVARLLGAPHILYCQRALTDVLRQDFTVDISGGWPYNYLGTSPVYQLPVRFPFYPVALSDD